ncbi:MAG: hypothetical protein V4463_08410 [Pseudomonadota bacterium]
MIASLPPLQVADPVFIRVVARPFREVASATGSWTNHVGIVVEAGKDPVIAESTFPPSRKTSLAREVLAQGAGVVVGEEERCGELLERHPQANVGFWKLWYFGSIPWQRATVTPASLLASPALHPVFEGVLPSAASRSPGSPG